MSTVRPPRLSVLVALLTAGLFPTWAEAGRIPGLPGDGPARCTAKAMRSAVMLDVLANAYGELNTPQPIKRRMMMEHLLQAPRFQAYLRELLAPTRLTWSQLDPFEMDGLISEYLDRQLAVYSDPAKVEALRRTELARALDAHGLHQARPEDARAVLEDQSRKNVQRLTRGIELTLQTPEFGRLCRTIDHLELRFPHNTTLKNVEGESLVAPLLSSTQLKQFGTVGGKNSQEEFNSEVLKSDGQVHFFADFVLDGEDWSSVPAGQVRAKYGDRELRVDPEYARKHGWISAFVMYSEELDDLAARLSFGSRPLDGYHPGLPESLKQNWRKTVAQLHEYDFTVDDFERLVKLRLKNWFQQVYRDHENGDRGYFGESSYVKGRKALEEKRIRELLTMSLTSGMNGLPLLNQLTIPVMVETNQVQVRPKKN